MTWPKIWRNIYTTSSYKCVLEVGNSVKDKSDSIRFLVLWQSLILGVLSQMPPGYAYEHIRSLRRVRPATVKITQKPKYLGNRTRWEEDINRTAIGNHTVWVGHVTDDNVRWPWKIKVATRTIWCSISQKHFKIGSTDKTSTKGTIGRWKEWWRHLVNRSKNTPNKVIS